VARKTIRSRRLGKQIRMLREQAHLNQDRLVEMVNAGQQSKVCVSQGQLSKVEAGSARLGTAQLNRIVAVLGVNDAMAARLHALRARAEEPGWWDEYSPYIRQTLEMASELGEEATTMRTYDAIYIQGLLQTEEYARTLIESSRAFVRPTEVETLVGLRMRRQARLADDSFEQLTAVLTEATLRHQIGTRATMAAQLSRLCRVAEDGLAAVHVLPNSQGPWPGLGSFVIFGFPNEEADVAYIDGDLGASIYEDRDALNGLTYTFSAALARALTARESLDLFRAVMKEYNGPAQSL
jgi:transcriptional regulator with XRE-family HTH domain